MEAADAVGAERGLACRGDEGAARHARWRRSPAEATPGSENRRIIRTWSRTAGTHHRPPADRQVGGSGETAQRLRMGALCCGNRSKQESDNSTRLKKGQSKDFDSGEVSDAHHKAAAQAVMFEMETKDKELDQRDMDALREINAGKKAAKHTDPGQYKGWKKRDASVDSG